MSLLGFIFKSKEITEDDKRKYKLALERQRQIEKEIAEAIRAEQKAYKNDQKPEFANGITVERLGGTGISLNSD